jgi:Tol biopolymer transport system component
MIAAVMAVIVYSDENGGLTMPARTGSWMCLLAWSIGCGNVAASSAIDAQADAPRDAIPVCDPTSAFDAPRLLDGFSDPNRLELSVTLSPDELNIYASIDLGVTAANWDLVSAQRADAASNFGVQTVMSAVNSSANDEGSALSPDGLVLAFVSDRVSGEGKHIYVSTRSSTLGSFGAPLLLAGINSTIAADSDNTPFFTLDGSELWFTSSRAGGFNIYRASRVGSGFGNPLLVPELNSTSTEFGPVLTADKLTVYFSSNRDGSGYYDIYASHRVNVTDAFPVPMIVAGINSAVNDFPGWISADNCRLYFRSDRSGRGDIYIAVRHPT